MSLSEERDAAIRCGLKRFHSDTPCSKCGGEVRHAYKNAWCVKCAKDNKIKSIIKKMEGVK